MLDEHADSRSPSGAKRENFILHFSPSLVVSLSFSCSSHFLSTNAVFTRSGFARCLLADSITSFFVPHTFPPFISARLFFNSSSIFLQIQIAKIKFAVMKTVEFIINSPDERVNEPEEFHDSSSSATETGASDAQNQFLCFDQTLRQIVASVLKKFTDVLAIYRSTLDNRISTTTSNDLDAHLNHFETMIKLRDDRLVHFFSTTT